MYYKSRKISFALLSMTAIVASAIVFLSITDPQERNLGVAALFFFCVLGSSLLAYLVNPSRISFEDQMLGGDPAGLGTAVQMLGQMSTVPYTGLGRIFFAVVIQVIVAVALFLFLR